MAANVLTLQVFQVPFRQEMSGLVCQHNLVATIVHQGPRGSLLEVLIDPVEDTADHTKYRTGVPVCELMWNGRNGVLSY